MVNYKLEYGVGETSRIFEVERDTVKQWAYVFREYLSKGANPDKGVPRTFTIGDIRVFGYVESFWEETPDIEYIKTGLNCGNHFENELIDNLIVQLTPLFQDMPEEIDETWRGTVFGGEYPLVELFELANSFKLAGDKLIDVAFEHNDERILFQPAIYNYRHAAELYIKSIVGEDRRHDLPILLEKFKGILTKEFNVEPPKWFTNLILAFHDSDPGGTTFRYGDKLPTTELFCDLRHVKKLMGWFAEVFRRIKIEERRMFFGET